MVISLRTDALQTDLEGAWRNKEVHGKLTDMHIVLDLHPGEASWHASVTETTSGIVKDTMTRIALERPDRKSTEVLAAAVLALDEMERVRGFFPAQWARGPAPNWDQSFLNSGSETPDPSFLEHLQGMDTQRRTTEESISSKKQALGTFQTWRRSGLLETRQRQRCATTLQGRFRGGAVVLETSTKIDEEDGSRKPRKVVWITHAGTLIQCAPEQLRNSSERARQLANMDKHRDCRGPTKV